MGSNKAIPSTSYASSQNWATRPTNSHAVWPSHEQINTPVMITLSSKPSLGMLSARSMSSVPAMTTVSSKKVQNIASRIRRSRSRNRLNHTSRGADTSHSTKYKVTFKWVKGELIGKGSYGRVYLALNATTGELMAVKQVELARTASDRPNSKQRDIMQALKFESDTLKVLDHEHIVQYLGYEETDKSLSIFLEYVPGGTISSCLQDHGRFREEVTKSFTSQILEGLEYLHSRDILHRDLKADNILVEPTGICKISDFGIAKKVDDINRGRAFTKMKGTVFWMAPEVLESDGQGYDLKVDIWSVGCIVLEMWSGVRPWNGEQLLPVMLKLSRKLGPPIPPGTILSESALHFRRQCFHTDPRDRPSAAELRKHPYLMLPQGWKFDSSDIQRSPAPIRPHSTASRKSNRSLRHNKSSGHQYSPPVPFVPGLDAYAHDARDNKTFRPSDILRASNNINESKRYNRENDGPPLVFITPPGSPTRKSSYGLSSDSTNTSPGTSESARTSGSKRLKGFRIVNPDPEPDILREPFVYLPPPLPSPGGAYSAHLVPPSQHHITSPTYKAILPSSQLASRLAALSTSDPSATFSDNRHLRSRDFCRPEPGVEWTENDSYSESDSDLDEDTSLWKKPPVDFVPSRKSDRSTWATRPHFEQVYENLENFFPHHDLDKAVIDVNLDDSDSNQAKIQSKKSIRMVAQERLKRDPSLAVRIHRRTKLWDHKVEELRM